MLKRTTFREIRSTFGRYIAIFAIIALGVGFFAGLSVAKPAMVETADEYITKYALFDYKLISTMGYDDDSLVELRQTPGVIAAEGSVSADVMYVDDAGSDNVLIVHSITDSINKLNVLSGRMPQQPNECIGDPGMFTQADIGKTIVLSENNEEDTLDKFAYKEYTLTGICESVYYINFERGSTSLGNGTVAGFLYIPEDGFDVDYYTEVYLSLDTAGEIYSDEYTGYIDDAEQQITDAAESAANARYDSIIAEAEEELAEGRQELTAAVDEYLTERADAEKELEDARIELSDAENDIADAEREIADGWSELRDKIAEAEQEIADGEQELADAYIELTDAELEYDKGFVELYNGRLEYRDGLGEYHDGYREFEEGLAEYNDGVAEYEKGLKEIEDAERQLKGAQFALSDASAQLESAKAQLEAGESGYTQMLTLYTTVNGIVQQMNAIYGTNMDCATFIMTISSGTDPMFNAAVDAALAPYGMDSASLAAAWNMAEMQAGAQLTPDYLASVRASLDAGWQQYNEGLSKYRKGRREYEEGREEVKKARAELEDAAKELAEAEKEIQEGREKLDEAWAELEDARIEIEDGERELADARVELDDGWAEYYDGLDEIAEAKETLRTEEADAIRELQDGERELADGKREYADGLLEYEDGYNEAQEEFAKAEQEIADAEQELADAEKEISEIERPEVYVLDRSANIGYVCFESDSDIIANVANVFPVFFFLVAALICITTMTRMVDDQRTQIGVLKALGYSAAQIAGKYLFYSGSASVLGCIFGIFAGSYIFPKVLWAVYGIMYSLGDIKYIVDLNLSVLAVVIYLGCVLGATWISCRTELGAQAAELIRPKAPKSGKRVFLEYLPFIWKRIGFLEKVSIRNVFRYKKRLFMMVLGIGGCTALLLAGYGINDSISNLTNFQYEEITLYDASALFTEELNEQELEEFREHCGDSIGGMLMLHESTADIIFNGKTKQLNVIIPDGDSFEGYIDMHRGRENVPPPGLNEAVINDGLSEHMGISVGDNITVRDADMNTLTLTVSGIYDNYIDNYVYVSAETYEQQIGKMPAYKSAYINFPEEADVHKCAAAVLGHESVGNVTVSVDSRDRVGSMMENMVYVVILTIITSGLLAFIVIYNLTNININERMREIATIKVLGFYPMETASYVFRENMIMTFMGAAVGLGLGKALHAFIMGQIRVDMVAFDIRILPMSYVWSAVLTVVFALIVDVFMYFRLQKINMAESLKSIE